MTERTKFQPNYAVPPTETMIEVFEDKGITLEGFSTTSGISVGMLEGIVKGTEPITKDIADELEKATGVISSFWTNLENNYQSHLKRLGKK